MGNRAKQSADEALYKLYKYRAASPLGHQLGCMDVLTKERNLLQRAKDTISTTSRLPLVRRGSMIDKHLMAEECEWQSADAAPTCVDIQKRLDDLKNRLIQPPATEKVFTKTSLLESFTLSKTVLKGGSAFLMGIAGIHGGKDTELSFTIEDITSVTVDYATLRGWIVDGHWRPNVKTLQLESADWSKKWGKYKSLWIVTEVLYATQFTIRRQNGVSAGVEAQVPMQVPVGSASASITVKNESGDKLQLKAKRNKQFIVGYRTLRVVYNLDGTVEKLRVPDDGGLRGHDDNAYLTNLVAMEEDIFEVDEDGDNVPIPLLTPTKEELDNLEKLETSSKDSVGGASSSST